MCGAYMQGKAASVLAMWLSLRRKPISLATVEYRLRFTLSTLDPIRIPSIRLDGPRQLAYSFHVILANPAPESSPPNFGGGVSKMTVTWVLEETSTKYHGRKFVRT